MSRRRKPFSNPYLPLLFAAAVLAGIVLFGGVSLFRRYRGSVWKYDPGAEARVLRVAEKVDRLADLASPGPVGRASDELLAQIFHDPRSLRREVRLKAGDVVLAGYDLLAGKKEARPRLHETMRALAQMVARS